MKTIRRWLEQAFNWIDAYGWAIPAFLLGVGTGLIVMAFDIKDKEFTVAVIVAIGTVGAAGAALWTTQVSRKALDNQLSREQELREPNLKLSSFKIEQHADYKLHAELTNLGQFPIYVEDISSHSSGIHFTLITVGTDDKPDEWGFLIPPNESVRRLIVFSNSGGLDGVSGTLVFAFQYGPTAKKLHYLELGVNVAPDYDAVNVFLDYERQSYVESFFYEQLDEDV